MTTIVYRNGVLAGDTRMSNGCTLMMTGSKVAKRQDGGLVGVCGDSAWCAEVLAWGRGELEERPPARGDCMAILVVADGSLRMVDENGEYPVDAPYLAIGSGMDVALGALWMGADAEKVVLAAMAHNSSTGGRVVAVAIEG